jgi:signal transduction histidine kinase/hypoxanthine-guanine phosphoribosyltransferase
VVPATLESTLQRQPRPFLPTGWSDAVRQRGLFIDLSHAEWIELGALAQICLLTESARREGVEVTVALPLERRRRSEEHAADPENGLPEGARKAIDWRVSARGVSRRFLTRVGFEEALRPEHLGESAGALAILDEFDISTVTDRPAVHEFREQSQDQRSTPDWRRPVAFPLTWMTTERSELARRAKELSEVLTADLPDERRGIDRVSADALSNVVLFELVDNAIRYGDSPRALVAAWARPASVVVDAKDHLPGERGFVEWISKQDRPVVELVIGDSGRGIPAVLKPTFELARERGEKLAELEQDSDAGVLAWSFDRYSTSGERGEKRGTRGLFRVDRVVKKHAGMIGVRSAAELVGWDHGGAAHDVLFTAGQRLASAPGTVVRIQLPSVRDRFAPRPLPKLPESELAFDVIQLEASDEGGATPESVLELHSRLRSPPSDVAGHIVVLPEGLGESRQILDVLRDVAELRNPAVNPISVLALGDWELVRGASESLDFEIEAGHQHTESANPRHFTISDPFLLLGPHTGEFVSQRSDSEFRQRRWTATTPEMRTVLERLSAASDGRMSWAEFGDLDLGDEREGTLQALRLDTSIVALDDDGLSLLLHEDAVFDHVARAVLSHVALRSTPFGPETVAITPSLMEVKSWLQPHSLVPAEIGDPLAMICLAHRVRQKIPWSREEHPGIIVTGAGVERSRVESFAASLGIEKKRSMAPDWSSEPPVDLQVLPPGLNALVYADIVASGESAQRVLGQILRDGSRPVAVACILDGRDDPTQPLTAWGTEVPVVSLVEMSLRVRGDISGSTKIYIDPQGEIENRAERNLPEPPYAIKPPDIRKSVERHDALHFGHTGSHGGLHFTFYVNSKALLEEFTSAFEEEVEKWRQGFEADESATKLEVWYPKPEPKVAGPARQLAEALARRREDVVETTSIGREAGWGSWNIQEHLEPQGSKRDVVIIDWGSLKGNTLMGMLRLAANSGAKNVLACVCLSQLPKESEHLLASIRAVQGSVVEKTGDEDSQQKLNVFREAQPELRRVERGVSARVRFLSALPIPAFTPVECPVCQQLSQISRQKFASDNLSAFAEEQSSKRLVLQEREDTVSKAPVDLDAEPLQGANAVNMLVHRDELEEGLRSTRRREEIHDWILSLSCAEKSREETTDLMRLLAVETHWLRRAPLSFAALKKKIACLAGDLACDTSLPVGDRVNAVVVLRTCSKKHFAASAAAVYASAFTEEKIVHQLLYGVHTYLEPSYRHAPRMLDDIARTLKEMQKCINSEEGNRDVKGGEDIWYLENRAIFLARRADQWKMSPVEAWFGLSQELQNAVARHKGIVHLNIGYLDGRVCGYIVKRLLAGEEIDRAERDTLDSWLDLLLAAWNHIENFLVDKMVPALGRLEGLLRTTSAREALGDVAVPLLDLIEREVPAPEWEIAKLSRDLASGRRRVEDPNVWQSFERECQFLIEGLLEAGDGSGGKIESSRLIQLLESIPSPLTRTVEGIVSHNSDPNWIAGIDTSGMAETDTDVFYPASALRRLMTELLNNVARHHHERNGYNAARTPATVWCASRVDGDSVVLEVWNNGTKSSGRAGEGLKEIEHELAPFGGTMRRLEKRDLGDEPGITFKVLVTLQKVRR